MLSNDVITTSRIKILPGPIPTHFLSDLRNFDFLDF